MPVVREGLQLGEKEEPGYGQRICAMIPTDNGPVVGLKYVAGVGFEASATPDCSTTLQRGWVPT